MLPPEFEEVIPEDQAIVGVVAEAAGLDVDDPFDVGGDLRVDRKELVCLLLIFGEEDFGRAVTDEVLDGLLKNVMHPKRLGEPAEFGLLVRQIAENPYINAECIRLDGALRFPPK